MALTFPSSPVNGQTYVAADDATYVYSAARGAWVLQLSSGGGGGALTPGAVTNTYLATDAVATGNILDGTITAADLAATGVTASTYGDGKSIPTIAVNAKGQITAVTLTPVRADDTVTGLPAMITTNGQTLTKFKINPVDVSGGTLTVNLPASPSAGDWVDVADATFSIRTSAPIRSIIVATNDNMYNTAGPNTATLNTVGRAQRFIYVNATVGWIKGN